MSCLRLHPENHLVDRIGWLRAAVLGANDGIISTASLIVGVAAAAATHNDVLIAGVAALVAGAMSMAAGEYVSVSSQSDTEQADLARERKELSENPEFELDELAEIYVKRGVDQPLARQVAQQLMAKDALTTHARDELGISEITTARPVQAALTSAVMFSVGAAMPLLMVVVSPAGALVPIVSAASLGFLALLGAIGAKAGGANILRATARVTFWGALAMALTAGIGRLVRHGCMSCPGTSRSLVSASLCSYGAQCMLAILTERLLRRALIVIALGGLIIGLIAWGVGRNELAWWAWAAGTVPVVAGLLISMIRDFLAGRMGVDAVAFVSMSGALALGETLAGAVVAVMYAGGNVLEDFAVARAERDLKSLVDRAPRVAHRRAVSAVEDVPIEQVAIGDDILVLAGEVIPIDGVITSPGAMIDEAALTGEPIPVARREGELARSGTINAGDTFEIRATATAGESTYAGIVRMVTAAQTAKSPFIRLADRYALLLLPITLVVAGGAWFLSGDPVRGLAVLVAATPCPLILAAPVAFIAGVAQAARRGILIKGSGPLESLARTRTVMFDKTGTLTVGGARLVAIETAPGESPEQVLQIAGSLEQASHHVVAAAIVGAALAKGLSLQVPSKVRETMGSGLEGVIDGREVRVGSHQLVYGSRKPEEWAVRALRRAAWRSALSVFVAVDGRTIGTLLLADELRRETPRAVQALRTSGVTRIVMLTGDRVDAAETIGAALDLDAVLADRGPADKVNAVATEQRLNPTLMVGDGINDAPASGGSRRWHCHGGKGRERLVGSCRCRHSYRPT